MFALRRSLTRPILSPQRIFSPLSRLSCPRLVVPQAKIRCYTTEESIGTKANFRRSHYGTESTPSSSLFIHGIGNEATGGNQEEVTALFNGFANLTEVRMARNYSFVETQTVEQGAALMEEHKKNPFTYKDKTLYLDFQRTAPRAKPVLQMAGFTGGEQHLRNEILLGWEDKIQDVKVVKSKLSDGEIAYVTFHSMDDALATKKACAALFPHLEVTLTHGSGADRSSRAEDFAKPTDTICVVGYDGTQEEFRKFFDEFRLDIHDVRRPARHVEEGRWDFVFVQFHSTEKAKAAVEQLKEFDQFRLRYATSTKRPFSIKGSRRAPDVSGRAL